MAGGGLGLKRLERGRTCGGPGSWWKEKGVMRLRLFVTLKLK